MFTDRTKHWLNVIFRDEVRLPGVEGVIVPSGTTPERPSHPSVGTIRYNTTEDYLEVYMGGASPGWEVISSGANNAVSNASNVGTGHGVFKQKSGSVLEFKSLVAGGNIVISDSGSDEILISTSMAVGESNTGANLGSGTGIFANKTGLTLNFKTLNSLSPSALSITSTGTDVNFTLSGAPYLPLAGGTLSGFLSFAGSSKILNVAGSESVPTYTFVTDNDTGMFLRSSNSLAFTTAGNERLKIESDGTLSVPASANYENKITDDDDIPNKKYVDDQISLAVGLSQYRQSFTNANLISGMVQFAHNLSEDYVQVTIYDNTNRVIIPDNIFTVDSNITDVDLYSYGTLSGTWHVLIIG